MRLKKFTLKNLLNDHACDEGLEFVTPVIKAKGNVALALKKSRKPDWIEWAASRGYDVSDCGERYLAARFREYSYGGPTNCDCDGCRSFRANIAKAKRLATKETGQVGGRG